MHASSLRDSLEAERPSGWDETHELEPIFRAWIGGDLVGYPFFTVLATDLTADKKLRIDFPLGTIVVTGPRTMEFYDLFCGNRATKLRADGKEIESVEFIFRQDVKEVLTIMTKVLEGEITISDEHRARLIDQAKAALAS